MKVGRGFKEVGLGPLMYAVLCCDVMCSCDNSSYGDELAMDTDLLRRTRLQH